jgi:hypothetical protein
VIAAIDVKSEVIKTVADGILLPITTSVEGRHVEGVVVTVMYRVVEAAFSIGKIEKSIR